MQPTAHLKTLGGRLRSRRQAAGWTQAELADKAGISLRSLVDLEKGEGNPSLLRLMELAEVLNVSLVELFVGLGPVRDESDSLAALAGPARVRALAAAYAPERVALVGLRGAGKSTVGQRLAQRLGASFVEIDARVEALGGARLATLFEDPGAARYRELERRALEQVLAAPGGVVLAAGGSVVTDPLNWGLLRRGCRTVWLSARPESHLMRVERQGDRRPMRGRADALTELKALLAHRAPLYAQAEIHVDTEGRAVEEVVHEVLSRIG